MLLRDFLHSVRNVEYRKNLLSAAITFLVLLISVEGVLLVTVHTTFPNAQLCSQISYLLALMGMFFAPLAFLTTCRFKVSSISIDPFLKTAIVYVLPATLIQLLYAVPAGETIHSLLHGLYLLSLIASIWGFHSLLHSLELNYDIRKMIIIAVFVISLFTVVIFNTVLKESPQNRGKVIQAVMISNPVVATSAIYDRDVMRGRILYEHSLIGPNYKFNYPSISQVGLFNLIIAVVMAFLSTIVSLILGIGKKKEEAMDEPKD